MLRETKKKKKKFYINNKSNVYNKIQVQRVRDKIIVDGLTLSPLEIYCKDLVHIILRVFFFSLI